MYGRLEVVVYDDAISKQFQTNQRTGRQGPNRREVMMSLFFFLVLWVHLCLFSGFIIVIQQTFTPIPPPSLPRIGESCKETIFIFFPSNFILLFYIQYPSRGISIPPLSDKVTDASLSYDQEEVEEKKIQISPVEGGQIVKKRRDE